MLTVILNGLRELGICDEEGGDALLMEEADQGIDFWVHDWLADQREGTVLRSHTLGKPLRLHTWHTCSHGGRGREGNGGGGEDNQNAGIS